MKCIAQTSRWGVKPCPNNAKCDGYCYAHHPSVVLAKLELEERAGHHVEGIDIRTRIRALQDTVAALADKRAPKSLGEISDSDAKMCLEIGKRLPSLRWWYSPNEQLGCSPREAVDAGRLEEVEALL